MHSSNEKKTVLEKAGKKARNILGQLAWSFIAVLHVYGHIQLAE